MFDDGDAERLADTFGRVPDGVFDASQYGQIFENIFCCIENIDFNSPTTGIQFMMNCINECYDNDFNDFNNSKATDVIIALSYFVINSLSSFEEDSLEEFMRIHRDEVIPNAIEETKALPFYDIKNDVLNIMNVLDEISNGDYSNVKFISPDEASDYGIDLGVAKDDD